MSFLVPWFAAFAALAALPIIIHLLGRPRATRRPFAAMEFLLRAERQNATRHRVREILLLIARALAIAAVPLALAKSYLEVRSNLPAGLGTTESAVLLIDDSRSMGFGERGATWLDRARERARRIVLGLGHRSEAAVFLTSRGAVMPQGELTTDRARLAQIISQIRPTHRPGDLGTALRRAAGLLAEAHHPVRRIYLISDLAAHGIPKELAASWPAGAPSVVAVDVTEGAARRNRAVIAVRAEAAPELGPRGLALTAEIANFGPQPLKGAPVTLYLDGKAVAKGLVDVPAWGRIEKRFSHSFGATAASAPASPPAGDTSPGANAPAGDAANSGASPLVGDTAGPGTSPTAARARSVPLTHEGRVELGPDPGDGLEDDDRRHFRIDERRSLRVLLVDGDPRTNLREDEVYYLETALRPGAEGDLQFDVTTITVEALGEPMLQGVDVVFLANVKAPDAERAAALRGFVERGGGLFLALGGNVDPDAWNASLGALLPEPLASLRTVGPTRDQRDDGEVAPAGVGERIDRFDRGHPVLEPFGQRQGGADEALREARVGRFALLQPGPRGEEERRVLLRLESGAPLLVEGRRGMGRVLCLTTTLDRDWSDLAIQPGYLPLVQQSARYLAGALLGEPEAPTLVGEPHFIPIGEGIERVEVEHPTHMVDPFGADRVAGRKALEYVRTDEPGIYHVMMGTAGRLLRPRPDAAFAVNVDPSESDLRPAPPTRLTALERPTHEAPAAEAPRRRVELWHGLGLALLVLLLIEGVLGARRAG